MPKLADVRPFYCLDPGSLTRPPEDAARREIAARVASTVGLDAMEPADLIVCGSVAVSSNGARPGKGAGYSDIEMALLAEARLLTEKTTIATTVHDLQVLDDELPEEEHDFRVDLIGTPERVIQCPAARRPAAIYRKRLTQEQIAAIPALRQ